MTGGKSKRHLTADVREALEEFPDTICRAIVARVANLPPARTGSPDRGEHRFIKSRELHS